MKIRRLAALVALTLAGSAMAESKTDSLLSTLSRCDSTFFNELKEQSKDLQSHFQVSLRGSFATIPVPDITHPTNSRLIFASPMKVAGLDVVGYFDEVVLIPGGVLVSWGFLVAASVQATEAAFRPLIWGAERLRDSDGAYVRSEIWHHSNPSLGWSFEVSEPGPPKPGTVERVFMVEPYFEEDRFIRAGCSLQGEVRREQMQKLRPDFLLKKPDA